MAREWDGGQNWGGLISSILTPYLAPGTVPFSTKALRQTLQNSRAEDAAKAANDQRSGDAAARLAFDKRKHADQMGLDEKKHTLEGEKADSKNKKEAGVAYEKSLPGLQSGDSARTHGELEKLRAAGFGVSPGTRDDAVVASPAVPTLPQLEMPGFHAPGMTGAGEEATGSLEGFKPTLEGEQVLELNADITELDDLEIVPGSTKDIFHVQSPDGTVLGTVDIRARGKDNTERIVGALGTLADYYQDEHPLPAAMLREAAPEIARTVMASPDGTNKDALEAGVDLFMDLADEENKDKRAAMVAQAKDAVTAIDHDRGVKAMRSSGEVASLNKAALQSLAHADTSILQMKKDIESGAPMDSIRFIKVMYDIIRAMEGKGARITDKDFQRAFGISSYSEDISNYMAGKLSLGSFDNFKSMLGGSMAGTGEVSLSRLDDVERFLDDQITQTREVYDGEFSALKEKYDDAREQGGPLTGYANGMGSELKHMYPEEKYRTRIDMVIPEPLAEAEAYAPAPVPAGLPGAAPVAAAAAEGAPPKGEDDVVQPEGKNEVKNLLGI